MKRLTTLLILLLSFSVYSQNTYLHCGKIIDTKNGKVLNKKTIIVSSDKIVDVKNGYVNSDNSDDIIINLKSMTVMPGLIDLHVHLESQFTVSYTHLRAHET